MAHKLSLLDSGVAEMAYTGASPWHQLGQKVDANAPIEQWLEMAHLQWDIKNSPVKYMNGEMHDFNDFRVLYRSDTNAALSVVSDRYKVVQPRQMLEFFRTLVDEEGFSIETVGALRGGRQIWAQAKTNIEAEVGSGDIIKAYLFLVTSCDSSLATTAKFVTERVVCANTQAIALAEGGHEVRVRHNTRFDADRVKGQMGLMGRKAFAGFMDNMRQLTDLRINTSEAEEVLTKVLPVPTGATPVGETKGFKTIMGLFQGGAAGYSLPGVAGTGWGLLNAVTEYVDHHSRSRSNENRFNSAMFGVGANLKAVTEHVLLTA